MICCFALFGVQKRAAVVDVRQWLERGKVVFSVCYGLGGLFESAAEVDVQLW